MSQKSAYWNILSAINNDSVTSNELFHSFITNVNGESIFELSHTELGILEFIRSHGHKVSLTIELVQENPKTGEIIKRIKPKDKITTDLISYKHTPYQYTVAITT